MRILQNFVGAIKRQIKSNNLYDRWNRLTGRTQKVAAIFVFALTGVAVTFALNAAELAREETAVLSNGVEVRLGESADEVIKRLGSSAVVTKGKEIIQYPKPSKEKPVEVLIYTDGKIIVAVNIINNTRNRIKTSPVNLQSSREELVSRYSNGARRKSFETISDNDYKLKLNRAAAYYEFDACSGSDKVETVTIAYASAEKMFGAHSKPNCEADVD